MLFVLTYEPILEVFSDTNSFGFRKSRNAHQAIGTLAYILKSNYDNNNKFYVSKYVLNLSICNFFEKIHHEWILENFPVHKKHYSLLKLWLMVRINYNHWEYDNLTRFTQGRVFEYLLVNFSLNGLEEIIKPSKSSYKHKKKYLWNLKKDYNRLQAFKQSRVIIRNFFVRYAEDFIIVTNHKNSVADLKYKIKYFLNKKGLRINKEKSKYFKFNSGQTLDFLGFTYKYIKKSKNSRLTKKVNFKGQIIKPRTGLFVYVSNKSVKKFKLKLKTVLKHTNKSPYQIITALNIIIKRWCNYFAIGSYETFNKLDNYIFKRCFKFICKKFPRMGKYNMVQSFFKYPVLKTN